MRKLLLVFTIAILGIGQASAQDFERGIFNHLGANFSVGTEGIGIGIAAPCTEYLEFGLGINFFPGIKIKDDVTIDVAGLPIDNKVNIKGSMSRTTLDFKANVYPFGNRSSFFVAAGFSFGGRKIFNLNGHNDDVAGLTPEERALIGADLADYRLEFDENGDINGDVRVKSFRLYLGLGFGRLIPKKRVGFRFELGCQFMGKMRVYQNDSELETNNVVKGKDDLSKWLDKLKVYPVLKFTLTGRIF
jgi:hypothetical protein